MAKNLPLRAWFYFRTGWGTYFALLFYALNTLVVTYYLAIENYGSLNVIFPTFLHYVVTAVLIGIPILITAGYIHFKKSGAFRVQPNCNCNEQHKGEYYRHCGQCDHQVEDSLSQ